MPDIASGLTVEGQATNDPGDVNSDAGWAAALTRAAGKNEPEAAPAEEHRSGPVTPFADTASDIIAQVSGKEGSTRVADGLTTHEPGEAAQRREEADRVSHARAEAEEDPDVLALSEQELTSQAEAEELAAYRRAEAVEEHLATLETSDDLNERTEAWNALTADERREAVDLGFVADSDAGELSLASQLFAQAVQQQQAQERAARAAHEDIEARTDALDQWARERGLDGAALERRTAEIDAAIRQSGWHLGHLSADEWAIHWRAADGVLLADEEAARITEFKQRTFGGGTDLADGYTENGVSVKPAERFAPKPDYSRVSVTPKRDETAAEIKASVAADSPLAAEYKKLQRQAGKQFDAAARQNERTPLT